MLLRNDDCLISQNHIRLENEKEAVLFGPVSFINGEHKERRRCHSPPGDESR